ncbi:MAG: hypothetical protein C3F07_13590 [Anaerolineales bacterium]|nr:MAG: hypothetical protein C3F07_13590 [Anaerolineales bacterium]
MLNRTPPNKPNTTNVIKSYRKRRLQRGPFLVYGAVGLVILGGIMLAVWLTGSNKPLGALFPTETSTPTLTLTPTNTVTPSLTSTVTETPTETLTPTPSGPFPYTIVEGDTLPAIAERFNLGDDGVLLIIDYNPAILEQGGIYYVGQTITIPPPGTTRATSTPIPADLPRGTRIEYSVLPGDTLAGIAAKFNSLTEDIITVNKIEDANALNVGDVLQIPVNLVTATATLPPTSTPVTPTVAGQPTQAATTPSAPGTASATCAPAGNTAFVNELVSLINNARTSNGLPALSVNQRLVSTASEHATDMICNNYLSSVGLDGSTPQSRAAAQGYTASVIVENIYALPPVFGTNPQVAFDWWMNNTESRANILNSQTTEFGIAYVESDESLLGAYFVMVAAKP